jgi:hypothetical protein
MEKLIQTTSSTNGGNFEQKRKDLESNYQLNSETENALLDLGLTFVSKNEISGRTIVCFEDKDGNNFEIRIQGKLNTEQGLNSVLTILSLQEIRDNLKI